MPRPEPTTLLVCEGRCNPHLLDVEWDVEQARKKERLLTGPEVDLHVPVSPPSLRTLAHTAHVKVGGLIGTDAMHVWRCLRCGAERRY